MFYFLMLAVNCCQDNMMEINTIKELRKLRGDKS